jgi:hypothetical protein
MGRQHKGKPAAGQISIRVAQGVTYGVIKTARGEERLAEVAKAFKKTSIAPTVKPNPYKGKIEKIGITGPHIAFNDLIQQATKVLGGRDEALRWFGTPVAALAYATPVSVLGNAKGVASVTDLLTQIEYGVW